MQARSKLNQAGYVMVFLLITISTLLYGAVHQAVLGLVYLGIALMTVFWATDGLRSGAIRVSLAPIQLILFLAGIYGLIQVVPFGTIESIGGVDNIPNTISLDPFATQVNALHFLGLGLFFSLVCVSLDSASRLRKVAIFVTVFGAGYAFFAILQSVLSPTKIYGLLEASYAQPFGSFISRNNFAAWMEMAIAMPMGMLFSGSVSKDKRLIYLTAAVLMGVSIVLSGSRGGLMALLLQIAFLFFITFSTRDRSSTWLKVVLGIGLFVSIVAGTAFVGGENTFTRISQETGSITPVPEGVVTRPHIWNATLDVISSNMPFGVGLGAFGVAYTKFDEASGFERVEQAHSDYLQVVSDAGFVGGVLGLAFLYLVVNLGQKAIRTSNPERRGIAIGAFAGIVSVLIHSLFDFVLHTTAIALLFLTLLGLLVAARSQHSDDDTTPPGRRRKKAMIQREA